MMCDKVVWDKVVCERWCLTKLCVKDGLWQSCVWKMVGERGCVTKWCVKDGASQSSVWKMVCDKVVCVKMVGERLYVTPHFTLHARHFILHTPHSTLYTFPSTLHTLHFTLDTRDSTLYTLHFTLTVCTLHSTLHTLHSTLHTLHFTLRTPPTTVYTLHCPPPTVMILSALVNLLLEAQTICSTFGRLLLALQPFAPPFLSITSHPLANYLVPNPHVRCSPLSFGVPPFSSVFPLLWTIFLHFLSFFSYLFPVIPPFSSISSCFQRFSFVFSALFPVMP